MTSSGKGVRNFSKVLNKYPKVSYVSQNLSLFGETFAISEKTFAWMQNDFRKLFARFWKVSRCSTNLWRQTYAIFGSYIYFRHWKLEVSQFVHFRHDLQQLEDGSRIIWINQEKSTFWKRVMEMCGVKLKMSTSRHPQTDGASEVMNRMVENYLRCYCSYHQCD